MPQPPSPQGSPEPFPALPEEWDYVLPSGDDPPPVPQWTVTLDEAENHFRQWIDAFPSSWPSEAARWAIKGSALFVMHDNPTA